MLMVDFCMKLAVLVQHRKKKYINKVLSLSLEFNLSLFPLISYFLLYPFLYNFFSLITSHKITQSKQP